jgi:hypothetical protein
MLKKFSNLTASIMLCSIGVGGTAALAQSGASAAAAAKPASSQPAKSATVLVGKERKKTRGLLIELQAGDVACYVTLKDDQGKTFEELAEFEICERTELLKKRVALSYVLGTVMADSCQGDMDCKDSKTVALIHQIALAAKNK